MFFCGLYFSPCLKFLSRFSSVMKCNLRGEIIHFLPKLNLVMIFISNRQQTRMHVHCQENTTDHFQTFSRVVPWLCLDSQNTWLLWNHSEDLTDLMVSPLATFCLSGGHPVSSHIHCGSLVCQGQCEPRCKEGSWQWVLSSGRLVNIQNLVNKTDLLKAG